MAFESGPIGIIGTNQAIAGLTTQAVSGGVQQALGQVWQGMGQNFLGSAGQSLGGALAGSAVNIALNSKYGTSVSGPSGFNLTSGQNILASTLTPYVTGNVAAGINQQIQKSLQSAGPFGTALSTLGTGLVNQALGGVTNSIFDAATPGSGKTNYKMFPGGGGEPDADYGGSSYTLNDVVFSLQPANQGPQAFGLSESVNYMNSATTVPYGDLTSMTPAVGNPVVNDLKVFEMTNPIGLKAFSLL